jgi:hypothetical protein
VLYILKANVALNSEMHNLLQVQLNTNKIKFLQDDRAARLSLQSSAEGKRMSPPEREEYLRPFVLTSILKTELLNLREDNENNVNTILKKVNTSLKKDKVSSLEMGIYYIKTEEEDKKNRRKRDFSKYLFMN